MDQPVFEPRPTTPHGELIGRIAMTFMGVLFLAVCGYLAGNTWVQCRRARIAKTWPTTEATITSSLGYHYPLTFFSKSIHMTYRYNPDPQGPSLTSTRLCYGRYRFWSLNRQYDNNTPYPRDTVMPVHYNPDDPTDSVLLTKVNIPSTLHATTFTVCLGFAGLFLAPKSRLGEPALAWLRSWTRLSHRPYSP
jgi:hypothetical protein